jgi:hypothetical protein
MKVTTATKNKGSTEGIKGEQNLFPQYLTQSYWVLILLNLPASAYFKLIPNPRIRMSREWLKPILIRGLTKCILHPIGESLKSWRCLSLLSEIAFSIPYPWV